VAKKIDPKPVFMSQLQQTDPFSFEAVSVSSTYDEFFKAFGSTFGEKGSNESVNAFISLIYRDLYSKKELRRGFKRRTNN
jgi:hypothetical protein